MEYYTIELIYRHEKQLLNYQSYLSNNEKNAMRKFA